VVGVSVAVVTVFDGCGVWVADETVPVTRGEAVARGDVVACTVLVTCAVRVVCGALLDSSEGELSSPLDDDADAPLATATTEQTSAIARALITAVSRG
jgi:hypothetical protein